jgi:predicted  nucleic acid-binding Zn-ribbon protein
MTTKEKVLENKVFEEARKQFEEAQHLLKVDLTKAKYADLYGRQEFLKAQISNFQEELAKVDKEVDKLRTEGI